LCESVTRKTGAKREGAVSVPMRRTRAAWSVHKESWPDCASPHQCNNCPTYPHSAPHPHTVTHTHAHIHIHKDNHACMHTHIHVHRHSTHAHRYMHYTHTPAHHPPPEVRVAMGPLGRRRCTCVRLHSRDGRDRRAPRAGCRWLLAHRHPGRWRGPRQRRVVRV
jgi:hypothetical protein